MSKHIYFLVVSRQIYLYINIHIGRHVLATLGVIEYVDCISWDRTTGGGMATIDPVVLAWNKPLFVKAWCINLPVHDKMLASTLVRRNINATCSSISRTRGNRDDTCDISIFVLYHIDTHNYLQMYHHVVVVCFLWYCLGICNGQLVLWRFAYMLIWDPFVFQISPL